LALLIVFVVCLAVVLAERYVDFGSLLQVSDLGKFDLERDLCVARQRDDFSGGDIQGPIALRTRQSHAQSDHERAFLQELGVLAMAGRGDEPERRHELRATYQLGDLSHSGTATVFLCDRVDKTCRIREFRLLVNVSPQLAARIAFDNTIKGRTELRPCHADPRTKPSAHE
jgi:hypothetical protein